MVEIIDCKGTSQLYRVDYVALKSILEFDGKELQLSSPRHNPTHLTKTLFEYQQV
jgi:hypothetical protein